MQIKHLHMKVKMYQNRWWSVLLWVVALLNFMDRQMLSTMQEAMKADIAELNKAEAFGALMAIFLWIYGFLKSRGRYDCRPRKSQVVGGGQLVRMVGCHFTDGICRQFP